MQHKSKEKIDRLLKAIERINADKGRCPTQGDLVKETGMPAVTVSRYLNYMSDNGMIEYEPGHKIKTQREMKIDTDIAFLPVVGAIACGAPELEEENISSYMPVPKKLLGKGEYYILETYGMSMVNVGIEPGDMVIMRKTNEAQNGNIVAIRDEAGETTLKRFYRDKKHKKAILHPENDEMQDFTMDNCTILGVAIKLIKDLT